MFFLKLYNVEAPYQKNHSTRKWKTWILISAPLFADHVALSKALNLTEPYKFHEEAEKTISEPNCMMALRKGFGIYKTN